MRIVVVFAVLFALVGALPAVAGEEKWFLAKTLKVPAKLEGTVDPNEPATLFTLALTNSGTKVISNYNVTSGCSCLIAAEGVGPILPGQTRYVDLWFYTGTLTRGKQSGKRDVYIHRTGTLTLRYAKVPLHWRVGS